MTFGEDLHSAAWLRVMVLDHLCTVPELIDRFDWYLSKGIVLMPNRAEYRAYHRDDKLSLLADLDVTWMGQLL